MRLIRANKFITGLYTSKLIGVSRQTVSSWLELPKVKKEMDKAVDKYISKIEESKDWKASAYLLDKASESTISEKETNSVDLSGLIIVNTTQ